MIASSFDPFRSGDCDCRTRIATAVKPNALGHARKIRRISSPTQTSIPTPPSMHGMGNNTSRPLDPLLPSSRTSGRLWAFPQRPVPSRECKNCETQLLTDGVIRVCVSVGCRRLREPGTSYWCPECEWFICSLCGVSILGYGGVWRIVHENIDEFFLCWTCRTSGSSRECVGHSSASDEIEEGVKFRMGGC